MIEFNIEKVTIQKLIEEPNQIINVSEHYFKLGIATHIFKELKKMVDAKEKFFDVPSIIQKCTTQKYKINDLFNFLAVGEVNLQTPNYYITLLKEKYFKEKLKSLMLDKMAELQHPDYDFYEVFSDFEKIKQEVEVEVQSDSVAIQDSLNDAMNELHNRVSNFRNNKKGLETGYSELDKILSIENGNMILLAARPSMGKTSFANNLAINFARAGKKVLYLSLEVSTLSLTNRILLSENSNIDSDGFRYGSLNDNELQSVEQSINLFNTDSISIVSGRNELNDLIKIITLERQRNGIDVVIIDYLGMIRSKGNNPNERMGFISQEVKSAGLRNDIPIVALAQLNRNVEARGGDRYQLSDLRDSGSLEQDADTVIFLHNQYQTDVKAGLPTEELGDRKIQLQVLKNRNGGLGDVELFFNKTITKFYSTNEMEANKINDDLNNILNTHTEADF